MSEGRLELSDTKSIMPPSYITNKLPLVASLLALIADLAYHHRNFFFGFELFRVW